MGDVIKFRVVTPDKPKEILNLDIGGYIFEDKSVQKSSTNVLSKAKTCQTCGCLKDKSRRQDCRCICHE
jgi:hypothetical protein